MIIYLYVKQHAITKLKYFGVTKKKDPFKYKGSGIYWSNHISKHGKDQVQTLEVWGFDDPALCREFALKFSADNDIVASDKWANLVIEDTIIRYTGGSAKHSASAKGMWDRQEYREAQRLAHVTAWQNDEYRKDQAEKRRRNWQDPDYIDKTLAANRASRKNKDYLANQKLKAKQQWSDPVFREKEMLRRQTAPKKIWINNGVVSRTIPNNEPLPGGFRQGRIYRKRAQT